MAVLRMRSQKMQKSAASRGILPRDITDFLFYCSLCCLLLSATTLNIHVIFKYVGLYVICILLHLIFQFSK